MKAAVFHEFGGPERVRVEEVPTPSADAGEVLIRVRACALNHLDLWVLGGLPALKTPLPFWTGSDIAGEVAAVGPGVTGIAAGARVAVNPSLSCGACEWCVRGEDSMCVQYRIIGEHVPGGLAEHAVVPAANLLPLPAHVSFEDAAAFILVNMTAWRMLVTQAALRPAEDLLILGVGGGVSSAAVQIGKLCGARVFVTSGSDEKLRRAKALGADAGVNYTQADWGKAVREWTGKRGADVVLDNVGAATWASSIRLLANGGRLVTCGATTGPIGETDIRIVFWRQLRIIGSTMANRKEFRDVMGQLFAGRLKAVVDRTFPLTEAAAALTRLQQGQQFGKLVVLP
ncbi:MAG: zinc-binding dehydrogenase [Candidatus Rokubacteria bacterium]|nr:zinc-binding dehydrogenase [Candidatus Rokubacteria bacterium]